MVSWVKAEGRSGCRVGLYSVSSGRDMVGDADCQPHVKCVCGRCEMKRKAKKSKEKKRREERVKLID